mgnify:CR=1 FL=1
MTALIQKAACIGGGVIGGGWVARFALNGVEVRVFDPNPAVERQVSEIMVNARKAHLALHGENRSAEGEILFCDSLEAAVADAELVQESIPERLDLKQQVLGDIENAASEQTIIGSSTSGLLPSKMQANLKRPEMLTVAHPFNPVYLLPLVELCGGAQTSARTLERAGEIYDSLGMKSLVIRKEIDAFIADRLLEAVWRESLHLVNDGVASTKEIDDAIRYGFGLRWAQMGLFQTYHVAGGEAGMRHFVSQFGPSLKWPWTKLMDVPELTEALIDKIADGVEEQANGKTFRDLEAKRDQNLVGILKALQANNWGAGALLNGREES